MWTIKDKVVNHKLLIFPPHRHVSSPISQDFIILSLSQIQPND